MTIHSGLTRRTAGHAELGVDSGRTDFVVALAGNPNTGKSTVFNRLTGLRQHTGNWPGKTVTRAEGSFSHDGDRFKLVDLPGTYSLLSMSHDEEIARDFLLFARPDVTVIVVDVTALERNLNLALQILEVTDRVVVCLNLMDEVRRRHIRVDTRRLAEQLGVPVVPTSARSGDGFDALVQAVHDVATGRVRCEPHRFPTESPLLERLLRRLVDGIDEISPGLPNARWVAMRLLDGDQNIARATGAPAHARQALLQTARDLRWELEGNFHEHLMESIYLEAARIADATILPREGEPPFDVDRLVDRIVTSRRWGVPLMILVLAGVLWITILGANVPSRALDGLLIQTIHPALKDFAADRLPWWLAGVFIDGLYLAVAWVVSVMLPPMAIFFPLFTFLEDLGYLPRVAFNLDHSFQKAGAHGKQCLTMCMGFGCNAAGVIATRVIDSPRERVLAILTNNFALCNGRWPTQILVSMIFIGALVPAHFASLVSAGAVVVVALLGVALTFVTSWALSRTLLRGEASTFSLELPPYRMPRVLTTLYTSLIDRTIFVLWRAVLFAAPAGIAIWLVGNVAIGEASLAEHLTRWLQPLGLLIGLNGVILLAYVVAIPANEIVLPTVLMLTVATTGVGEGAGAGVLFEADASSSTVTILSAGGWTLLTAINLLLFSLLHNPCSTTLYTIWKETRSARWTSLAAILPLAIGLATCFVVAQVWRLFTSA